MAHVVGVPRRDPCQKCQLPVFLAERLAVGKKIYHRTCLKCARCGSQLTPGSFYETEVDDEYCCETCPDEEEISNEATTSSVLLRNNVSEHSHEIAASTSTSAVAASATVPPVKHVRSSIADRLAFFEKSKADEDDKSSVGHKLLQKSVSDEEKTKSLKHMETNAAQYKMNSAFNSFLNDTIDGENEPEAESDPGSITADSKTETQMETSDTGTDNEANNELALENAPPALPKTRPPEEVASATTTTTTAPVPALEATANKRFTATAQLQLSTTQIEKTANETPEKKKSELQLNLTTITTTATTTPVAMPRITTTTGTATLTTSDNSNNNDSYPAPINDQDTTTNETTANQKLTHRSKEINLVLSETNDNDCVTKDKAADTVKAAVQTQSTDNNPERSSVDDVQTIGVTTDADIVMSDAVELRYKSEASTQPQQQMRTEDAATTERLSVVRARLQQFEVIANNKNNNNHFDNNNETPSPDNSITNIAPANSVTEASKPLTRESSIKSKLEETENKTENEIKCETKSENVKEIEDETKTKTDTVTVTQKPEELPETEAMEIENEMSKSLNEVPLNMKTKDNENVAIKVVERREEKEEPVEILKETESSPKTEHNISEVKSTASTSGSESSAKSTRRTSEDYPEDLNPFKSDDEDDASTKAKIYEESNKENLRHSVNSNSTPLKKSVQEAQNLNPFDSSDDEIELEKSHSSTAASTPSTKVPPPRPPPPRISRNPFGDDAEEDQNFSRRSSLSSSFTKKTPVPTPRSNLSQSQNPTPEPTPRLSTKSAQERNSQSVLQNSSDYYGSVNSLSSNATPQSLQRNSEARGSNNSLTSSAGGTIRGRKNRRAPAPPPPPVKELFPSNDTLNSSITSTPSSSTVGTPKSGRKKRLAPAPPKPARLDPDLLPQITLEHSTNITASKNSHSYPLQSELDSTLSDEEKALLEGKQLLAQVEANTAEDAASRRSSRRLIPLDASLLNDEYADDDTGVGKSDDVKHEQQNVNNAEESNVVYRRVIIPPNIDTPTHDKNSLLDDLNGTVTHDRQLEKLKDNKEAQNRNRQSQISASSGAEDGETLHYNKSVHGKWKRRKGPAPALPIPPRKVLQMLPLQEIRHELDIIEVQQQGLEKQGVILEKMIRDRCEGHNGEPLGKLAEDVSDGKSAPTADNVQNSKEVEDLILQLFELVNEKNELFRRQAELMYLRRQHRLEQEQADLEYEIRVLMAQPECNKTDTDKAREEALIARLVEVVQLRNEVIECLEMDRLREAEEDLSIKQQLELHSAKREDEDESRKTLTKLSKKEKKKQKEAKKLGKTKKIDADKDADETELQAADKQKLKKKKRTLTNLLKL